MEPSEKTVNYKPSISLQIPSFNNAEFLKEAIESCLALNYNNLKIAVFEDASTDNTSKVLEEYKNSEISIFQNETNLGRILNYQKAFQWSQNSDWFINLDGDDYYTDPDWISNFMDYTQELNESIVLIQTNFLNFVHKKELKILKKINENTFIISGYEYICQTIKNYSFSHLSCIYNTNIAKNVAPYTDHCFYADLIFSLRMASCGNVLVSNKEIGQWRLHEGNISHSKKEHEELLKNELAMYTFIEFLENKFSFKEVETVLNIYEKRELEKKTYQWAVAGRPKEVIMECKSSNKITYINFKHLIKSCFNYFCLEKS